MCFNSVPGGPINFIIEGLTLGRIPRSGAQNGCHVIVGCLATGLKIMGLMTSLTTYCSIANISNWCTCSPQCPCDVTHITLTVIHPQREPAVMSLTSYNAVIMPIVNVVILY